MKIYITIFLVSFLSGGCKKDNANRATCVECSVIQNSQKTYVESLCGTEAEVGIFQRDYYLKYSYHSGEKQCREK
jgi:hypothetical protein